MILHEWHRVQKRQHRRMATASCRPFRRLHSTISRRHTLAHARTTTTKTTTIYEQLKQQKKKDNNKNKECYGWERVVRVVLVDATRLHAQHSMLQMCARRRKAARFYIPFDCICHCARTRHHHLNDRAATWIFALTINMRPFISACLLTCIAAAMIIYSHVCCLLTTRPHRTAPQPERWR